MSELLYRPSMRRSMNFLNGGITDSCFDDELIHLGVPIGPIPLDVLSPLFLDVGK